MYSVNLYGSHPDANNDDCWTGDDFETKEQALRVFNNPWEHFNRSSNESCTAYIEIDGPDINQVRAMGFSDCIIPLRGMGKVIMFQTKFIAIGANSDSNVPCIFVKDIHGTRDMYIDWDTDIGIQENHDKAFRELLKINRIAYEDHKWCRISVPEGFFYVQKNSVIDME